MPKKALLLLGARQTGKTFTVRSYARERNLPFIEVNFLEDEENARFLSAATSVKELLWACKILCVSSDRDDVSGDGFRPRRIAGPW